MLDVLRQFDTNLVGNLIDQYTRHRYIFAFSPALRFAVNLNRPDIIAPLLPDRGDGPSLVDVTWENEELVRLLATRDARQRFGDMPLIDLIRSMDTNGVNPAKKTYLRTCFQQFQPQASLLYEVVENGSPSRGAGNEMETAWLGVLEAMLQTGVIDGDETGEEWLEALLFAVRHGHVEAVRLFLRYGEDPNIEVAGSSLALLALFAKNGAVYDVVTAAGGEVVWRDWESDLGSLEWAFRYRNLRSARRLLEAALASGPLSQRDLNAFLKMAAEGGHTELAHFLLEMGAQICAASAPRLSESNCDALAGAAQYDKIEILGLLLDNGAPEGEAIFQAAFYNRIKALTWCLDHGIDIDTPNLRGKTALMAAVAPNSGEVRDQVLDLILERKPNVNHVSHDGSTALSLATDCVGSINWHKEVGEEAEALAITAKNTAIIKRLLDACADPNGGFGRMPLINAAAHNFVEIVKLLLAAGADVNAALDDGETAWRIADRQGHKEIAILLEEAGAREPDISRKDLRASILWDRTKDALRLIDAGADLELPDNYGRTPLLAALQEQNDNAVIKRLLARGADPNVFVGENESYGSPLTATITQYRPDLVDILLDHDVDASGKDAPGRPPLAFAVSCALHADPSRRPIALGIVHRLLEAGASPNIHGDMGCTLLQLAALENDLAVMALLVDHDIDSEMQSISETFPSEPSAFPACTALESACMDHQSAAAQYLLELGANPNAVNKGGYFPLFLACVSTPKDRMDCDRMRAGRPFEESGEVLEEDKQACRIVKLLLKYSADVNLLHGTERRSALREARDIAFLTEPRCEMIRLLLDAGAPD